MASAIVGLGSPSVGAVILAGGRSSRMGTDKASLAVSGTPLLARVASAMAESIEGPILVVGKAARSCQLLASAPRMRAPRFWDYMCVDDAPENTGPADAVRFGTAVLLRRFPSIKRVVVTPCDLPHITPEAVSNLLRSDSRSTIDCDQAVYHEGDPRATIVRIDGQPQWLSCVVHRSLIDRFAQPKRSPQTRVAALFSGAAIQWFDDVAGAFRDADTPLDLRDTGTTPRPAAPLSPELADAS